MTTQSDSRYRDQRNNIVRLGERIGGGGEGEVFAVVGQPDSAAKIWNRGGDASKSARKVQIMSQRPASRQAGNNGYTITWPDDLLYEYSTQRIVGYTMRRIPGEWEKIIDYCSPVAAKDLARKQGQSITPIRRRRIAYNLCRAVNTIHQAGYVIGDISDQNVLVSRNDEVAVIDCDSFQVKDGKGQTLRTDKTRLEFQPPEIQHTGNDVDRNYDHDAFALAVLLFKLLCEGQHPYDCVIGNSDQYQNHPHRIKDRISHFHGTRTTTHWTNAWSQLEEPVKARFKRTFAAVEPCGRTKPGEWIEAFAPRQPNQQRYTAQRQTDPQGKPGVAPRQPNQQRYTAQRQTDPQGKPGVVPRQPNQQRYTAQSTQSSSGQNGAQSGTRNATADHAPVESHTPALSWPAVIQSAVLLAIISLAAGIALLIPQSRAWLSDTLGYGWVSVGGFVSMTPLLFSMPRTNAQTRGWRLWLASAVIATISVIAMALIDGSSGYGISGLWGHALTGGGKPFIAAMELFIAVEVLILLIVTGANAAIITMAVVAVLAFLALVAWIVYIIVIWIIANIVSILVIIFIIVFIVMATVIRR